MSDCEPNADGRCPHVMQTRCVNCGREHYMMRVWLVSHSDGQCFWCGEIPPTFTDMIQYRDLVNAAHRRDTNATRTDG